jgi:hypothetical protein
LTVEPFPAWVHVAALAVGLGVGLVDFNLAGDDALPSLLLLAVPAFTFGFVRPRGAWRWGILVGIGIPAVHLAGPACGFHPPYPVLPTPWVTLIVLVPALASAYLGAVSRRLLVSRSERSGD